MIAMNPIPMTMAESSIHAIGNTRIGSYPAVAINDKKPTCSMYICPILDLPESVELVAWDGQVAAFSDGKLPISRHTPFVPGRLGYINEAVYVLEPLGALARIKYMKSSISRIVSWDETQFGACTEGLQLRNPIPPEWSHPDRLLFRDVWPQRLHAMTEDFAMRCGAAAVSNNMNVSNPLKYSLNGLKLMWDEIHWNPLNQTGRQWAKENTWIWCVQFERRMKEEFEQVATKGTMSEKRSERQSTR